MSKESLWDTLKWSIRAVLSIKFCLKTRSMQIWSQNESFQFYLKNLNTIKSLWFSTETGGWSQENPSGESSKFIDNHTRVRTGRIKFELKYWLSSLLKRHLFVVKYTFRNESIQFYRKCHVLKETFLLKLPTVNCHYTEDQEIPGKNKKEKSFTKVH